MIKRERLAGLFFLIMGVAVIFYSLRELGLGTIKLPGPGFFPAICGVSIVVFSGMWLLSLRGRQGETETPFWEKGEWIRPSFAVALTMGYGAIMDDLGFIPATFAFLVAWQFLIEREKWLKTTIISLIGTAAMYTIFQYLLAVPLPRGIFD